MYSAFHEFINHSCIRGDKMGNLSYGLAGKVCVVTGASRGIGLEIARLLIEQDARVVICGRKPEGLEAATAELKAGDNLLAQAAHVAKEDDVNTLFDQTLARFGIAVSI